MVLVALSALTSAEQGESDNCDSPNEPIIKTRISTVNLPHCVSTSLQGCQSDFSDAPLAFGGDWPKLVPITGAFPIPRFFLVQTSAPKSHWRGCHFVLPVLAF